MEIVNWLDRDEVEKILFDDDGEQAVYAFISPEKVRTVLDLMEENGIKFYRSVGEV